MRVALLLNRQARRAADPEVERAIVAGLRAFGHSVEVKVPQHRMHAPELAREAVSAGFDLLVAAGGDGTVNEMVNGSLGSGIPIGVIPLGTVNVWSRCLGIPLELPAAVANIAQGKPRQVSLGQVNDRAFLFSAGFGIDGQVLASESATLKRALGPFSYYIQALTTAFTFRSPGIELAIDGGPAISCASVVFGKTPLYGDRFYLTPDADPYDDRVQAVVFKKLSGPRFVMIMSRSTSRSGLKDRAHISHHIGREAVLTARDPVHIQIDGEYGGTIPAHVRVLHRALSVIVPDPTAP